MGGTSPFGFWRLQQDLTEMGFEAGAIVAMRTLGMMGLWGVRPSEVYDMIAEKPPAFAEAWIGGVAAAMSGAGPDRVLAASLAPIGRKTKSNHRRLSRLGLRPY